ncbi:MAG: TIM barrel protein [Nocardioidaceae bacterium]
MTIEHERIRLGTAPDSWGVWFADDPRQAPWQQFLDEAAAAGYHWVELGPYGYLPTDPGRLAGELAARGLELSGGAVFVGLHRGAEALQQAVDDCRTEARLLTALGARHLVLLPEIYTDLDGSLNQPAELDASGWRDLTSGMNELAKVIVDEYDVAMVFHPHADSHVRTQREVQRFLGETDPATVNLCLDTGHIAYYHGDNLELIRRYPERVGYVHLKQVDSAVLEQVDEQNLCFADAVALGVMTEPPRGVPAMPPVIEALSALDVDLFAIVEQDLYPCESDVPMPIATRTREYFNQCGVA